MAGDIRAGAVVVDVVADAQGFVAAMKSAKSAAQGAKTSMGGLHGTLKDLKSQLGAKSDLAILTKTLVGGGAIAGLSILAHKFHEVTEAALEFQEQLHSGNLTTMEAVSQWSRTLPIFGELASAFDQIGVFFGFRERFDTKDLDAHTKAANAWHDVVDRVTEARDNAVAPDELRDVMKQRRELKAEAKSIRELGEKAGMSSEVIATKVAYAQMTQAIREQNEERRRQIELEEKQADTADSFVSALMAQRYELEHGTAAMFKYQLAIAGVQGELAREVLAVKEAVDTEQQLFDEAAGADTAFFKHLEAQHAYHEKLDSFARSIAGSIASDLGSRRPEPQRFAALAEFGTSGAQQLENRIRFGGSPSRQNTDEVLRQSLAVAKKQLQEQQKLTDRLAKLLGADPDLELLYAGQ